MLKSNNNIQQQNQSTALIEHPKMGLTSNEAIELRKKFALVLITFFLIEIDILLF